MIDRPALSCWRKAAGSQKECDVFAGTCCWRSALLECCVSDGSEELPCNQKVAVYRFRNICFQIAIWVPRPELAYYGLRMQSFHTRWVSRFLEMLLILAVLVLGEPCRTRTVSPPPHGLFLHGASHIFGSLSVEASCVVSYHFRC